jgi:hypothetical protein
MVGHLGLPTCSNFTSVLICGIMGACPPSPARNQEVGSSGVRGILIYCAGYTCSHSIAISADRWPDHVRLSVLETRFVCQVCGKRGADVRPDFDWNTKPIAMMGYR